MKSTIRKYAPPIFHCINDFGQGSLAALIPFFIANFNLNYYQSAAIIFCNTIVASIAQPVLGYVADRWRVPWFIPVGFAVTLVSISTIALATSYEMILALALMSGVGAALFHPEAALLVNRTQSHEIGNAMGRFAVGGSAGFALGPLIAGGVYVLRIIDFYTDFIHYCYQWRSRCIELGTYYVLCHGGCPHLYGWCIIR